MYSVQRVSRTPYSLKVVCLKQLLSLRVYKLQEDETTRGGLQAVIIAANPAAAIVESGFPHRSAVSFQ